METTHFLAWFTSIAAIAGFGIGTMIWAYKGSGSTAVLFPKAIAAPSFPSDAASLSDLFKQGYDAYTRGKYRQAIEKFNEAIGLAPIAQAYHNRGLAFANLRQDDDAAINLVRAGEIYAQQENEAGIATVKQNLLALKARKQAREEGK